MTTAISQRKATRKEIHADDVADYFIAMANETGDSVTNLRLQKLVYYAQAWHLANFEKPLFEEEFEAWVHGPVVPVLYHHYKPFGYKPIVKDVKLENIEKKFNPKTRKFLREVADVYMQYPAYALEQMTHQESPWIEARGKLGAADKCNEEILKDRMREYYAEKLRSKS